MYNIVEFAQEAGGGLAVVHTRWITPRKKEVFWPPYKENATFTRALKNGEEADESKWKLYEIVRNFYETDDLEKAKRKLKLAEETSDLNTDTVSHTSESQPKKRIRKPTQLSSSDEECSFQRPPRVNLKKKLENRVETDRHHITLQDESNSEIGREVSNVIPRVNRATMPSNSVDLNLTNNTPSSTPQSNSLFNQFELQKKILDNLMIVKQQNEQILNLCKRKQPQQLLTPCIPEDIPVVFPLKHNEDVTNLEIYLGDIDNLSALVTSKSIKSSYLASLGGIGVVARTNRMLRLLLTDELASKYNFAGLQQKKITKLAFSKLLLTKCIIRAVKTCESSSSEKEVEDAIKVWLKHAPERTKKLNRQTV